MAKSESNAARGVLICANPFSGSGPNRRYVDELVEALSAKGLEPRVVWDIEERLAALVDPTFRSVCRCVVVAGGDGSIGAVVNELDRAGVLATGDDQPGVALATLPMGNENLFARHFGFTREPTALAEAIELGRTRRVDLGRVTGSESESAGRLFTLMAGVGFDAEVVHRMDRWRTTRGSRGSSGGLRRVRRLSYLPRVVSSSLGYDYPRLTVAVDGRELSGTHLFVFNLPPYGGGLHIAPPGCRGDDGLLDWVLLDRPGLGPLLAYGLSVMRGRHLDRRDVTHGQASTLSVRCGSHAPIQVDGDPAGDTPTVFQVDGRARLELLIT